MKEDRNLMKNINLKLKELKKYVFERKMKLMICIII